MLLSQSRGALCEDLQRCQKMAKIKLRTEVKVEKNVYKQQKRGFVQDVVFLLDKPSFFETMFSFRCLKQIQENDGEKISCFQSKSQPEPASFTTRTAQFGFSSGSANTVCAKQGDEARSWDRSDAMPRCHQKFVFFFPALPDMSKQSHKLQKSIRNNSHGQ